MVEPLWLSFKLSLITTCLLFMVGIPLAYWLSITKSRFKSVIEAVVALPIVLPPTVLGFYILLAIGAQGPLAKLFDINLAFSFSALLIGSFFYSFPFAVQPIQSAFETVDRSLVEASYTMGKNRWQTFFLIILPLSRRGLLTGGVLSFAHTMGEFGVVLMVGGNIPGVTKVASIAIYDSVQAMDYSAANTLSLTLLLLSFAVLWFSFHFNKNGKVRSF